MNGPSCQAVSNSCAYSVAFSPVTSEQMHLQSYISPKLLMLIIG